MGRPWIPWPDRITEFAPVIGLHRLEMFYPTTIEAMITESCELMVFLGVDAAPGRPAFGRVQLFAQVPLLQKIQLLISPRLNDRRNYIDRHGGEHDVRKSAQIQEELNAPKNVYARGFRNEDTGEAYIVYRFFYVENLSTRSDDESRIADQLTTRPDKWWSHEGDWEGVSMHFINDPEATLPDEVVFSRHKRPNPKMWKNTTLERGRPLALAPTGLP